MLSTPMSTPSGDLFKILPYTPNNGSTESLRMQPGPADGAGLETERHFW